MIVEEAFAVKNNERVSIQCLYQEMTMASESGIPQQYHYHRYAELLFVTKGHLRVYASDKVFDLDKNDMILISVGTPHTTKHEKDTANHVIKFLPDILSSSEQTSREFDCMFCLTEPLADPVIRNAAQWAPLFVHAYEAFHSDSFASELLLRADVVRLCAEVMQVFHDNGLIRRFPEVTSIRTVLNEVRKRNGAITMHEAAVMCGFSDAYFSKKFKRLMDIGFSAYAKNERIAAAERKLRCTDDPVTLIAQDLGYATASHFIEDFRRARGVSPLKYRRS